MSLREYHDINHTRPLVPYEECFSCGKARADCRRKIKFWTWFEADEWVDEYNQLNNYQKPVTRYHCRHCGYWHMTTARGKRQLKRAEQQRRRWLVETQGKKS